MGTVYKGRASGVRESSGLRVELSYWFDCEEVHGAKGTPAAKYQIKDVRNLTGLELDLVREPPNSGQVLVTTQQYFALFVTCIIPYSAINSLNNVDVYCGP